MSAVLRPLSISLTLAITRISSDTVTFSDFLSGLSFLLKRLKPRIALNGKPHDRVTERHLPYGITQCYLLPDTSARAPP